MVFVIAIYKYNYPCTRHKRNYTESPVSRQRPQLTAPPLYLPPGCMQKKMVVIEDNHIYMKYLSMKKIASYTNFAVISFQISNQFRTRPRQGERWNDSEKIPDSCDWCQRVLLMTVKENTS